MNQNYTDIGLALMLDFNTQLTALSPDWEPDTTGILYAGWIAGLADPGVPELLDTEDRVSGLTESWSGGLVPPDLVEGRLPQTPGTGQKIREMPFIGAATPATSQTAAQKPQWNKPPDLIPDFALSPKSADPKTAPAVQDQPGPEPAAISPSLVSASNKPEAAGDTYMEKTGLPASGRPALLDAPDYPAQGVQEIRPRGKLSDIGNYRESAAPPFPEAAGETGEVYSQANGGRLPNFESLAIVSPPAPDTQNPASTVTSGRLPNFESLTTVFPAAQHAQNPDTKQAQAAQLDLDTLYNDLTQRLHDEYQRFYEG